MKKIIISLLIIITLTLSSCVSIQDTASTEKLADKALHQTFEAVGKYLSLEELIAASDVLLKGQCINCTVDSDHSDYEFEVLQVYRGKVEQTTINVYVPYYNVTVHGKRSVNYKTNDISYIPGENYLLSLLNSSNVYLPVDRYINVGGNLFIPTSNIKRSSVYGESLLKHSNLGSLTTEEKLLTYLCSQYDLAADSRSNNKITYISDTDFDKVITKSDFILQVKVGDEVHIGAAKDRNNYDCIVTDAIHGSIKNGEIASIVFPSGWVKTGDEIIVALFEIDNCSPRSFVLSSRSSLFSISQKPDIIAALNNQ